MLFKNKEHLFTFLHKCDNMFVYKEKMFVSKVIRSDPI